MVEDPQAAIEADYPKEAIPDALTREAREHEAFVEIRRRTYIGRPDYFERLGRHARGDGGPLVLLGDSGGGKSALLSNWLVHWREQHPKDLIIQHYIGSTPDSADHWRLMRRLIEEIKRWTDDPEEVPHSHDDLLKTFPVWLAKGRSKAERDNVRCILVLDALNQLEDRDRSRQLGWLPTHSFVGPLRLITSTLSGEAFEAAESRKWATVTVEPLTTEERHNMIAAYLGRFSKKLDQPRVDRLIAAPQTANPLYLKILLDELRVTGTHERLDERLNGYLKASDIPALLTLVLARYQRDYERDRPGLVGEVLGLIWAARRGLAESELLELLKPADQPQLPKAIWAPFRHAMEDLLVDRGGILNFAHEYLGSAVESAIVRDQDQQYTFRIQLADYFEAQSVSERNSDELPWLLWQNNSRSRLRVCLLDFDRFLAIQQRDKDEMMAYWVELKEERTMGALYLTSFDHWAGHVGRETGRISFGANQLAYFLNDAALHHEAEPLMRRALAIDEASYGAEHPAVAIRLNNLALLLQAMNRLGEAEPLMKRALAIDGASYGAEHPRVAIALHNLTSLLQDTNRLGEAEPLMRRAVEILNTFRRKTGYQHRNFELTQNSYHKLLQGKHGTKLTIGFMTRVRKFFQQ
ncbi:MAG: tetratricopeptide repeat protein [Nitrospira sp.]|nr:tetratricopeptide repeat protein [Nitrospira sp.]